MEILLKTYLCWFQEQGKIHCVHMHGKYPICPLQSDRLLFYFWRTLEKRAKEAVQLASRTTVTRLSEFIFPHLGPLSSLSELIRVELNLSTRSGAPPPSTGARCRGPPPAESPKEHLLWSSVTYKCVVGPTGCRGNTKVKEHLKKRKRKEHSKGGGSNRAASLFWLRNSSVDI